MRVGVDHAGDDKLACRIDLIRSIGQSFADGGDLAAANCDILHAVQSAGWVDHTAARDHEVKLFRHMFFLPG